MSPSPSSPTPRDEGSERRGREATWRIHPNQPSEPPYSALLTSSRYGGDAGGQGTSLSGPLTKRSR